VGEKMKIKIIVLFIIMIASFTLASLFFFNSGFFDMDKGYVTPENVAALELDLNNNFNSLFGTNIETGKVIVDFSESPSPDLKLEKV